MTHYHQLIDTLTAELYAVFQEGKKNHEWSEEKYKKVSHRLLTIVEEFKSLSSSTVETKYEDILEALRQWDDM